MNSELFLVKGFLVKRLFVGSLSWGTDNDALQRYFEQVGPVTSARVIMDRDTGRSKGFGFVEMNTEEDAQTAINRLNGSTLDGRRIVVNPANPPENRGVTSFRRNNNNDAWNS